MKRHKSTLPTYADFKRDRLIYGSSHSVPAVLALSIDESLSRFREKAIALEKILKAETVDALLSSLRRTKQAAIDFERQMQHQRLAAIQLQRWFRCHRSKRAKRTAQTAPHIEIASPAASTKEPIDPSFSSATHGLTLTLLAARGLALPSTCKAIHAEIQYLQNSVVQLSQTSNDSFANSTLEWTSKNALHMPNPSIQLEEWSCRVALYRNDKKCIGHVLVPADLLESPLALENGLTRWFPLEKPLPGEVIHGEIRISLQFIAAQADNNSSKAAVAVSTSRTASPLVSPFMPSKPAMTKRSKPRSPDKILPNRSPKTSPPRSPRSPRDDSNQLPEPPAKKHPYLKRKPYSVSFRKLDWSRVASKTDSNIKQTASNLPPPPTSGQTKPPAAPVVAPPGAPPVEAHSSRLEQLLATHSNKQMKLELMHLKQKAELHAIFHPSGSKSPSCIATLTRRQLSELQRRDIPVGKLAQQLQATPPHRSLLRRARRSFYSFSTKNRVKTKGEPAQSSICELVTMVRLEISKWMYTKSNRSGDQRHVVYCMDVVEAKSSRHRVKKSDPALPVVYVRPPGFARRFSDFRLFHQALLNDGYRIPRLPPANPWTDLVLKFYPASVIVPRMHQLQWFLNAVNGSPEIQASRAFAAFLGRPLNASHGFTMLRLYVRKEPKKDATNAKPKENITASKQDAKQL
ncbi:hypothetical protein AC1031_013764 [Aphanomyces cochlioides]|nr:hypothetical protein AC1031_013764 [Aphanomyces cochlioides]